MKLNFKGFFKAAGLFPLALMLSGCISYALVSHTAKGSSGKYQSQSDTITGLSQAKDSNGTKGYVFVGESLDYLITTTGITKKKRHWQRIMVLPVVFNTVPGHWKT